MLNINEKVDYMIGYNHEKSKNEVLETDFQQLEELLNLKLPIEYIEFIKETNGLFFDNAYFYFKIGGKTKYIEVRWIFSFYENPNYAFHVMRSNEEYINSLIPNYMIIGGDGMGFIIYNVENQKVQYWDGIFTPLSSENVHIIDLADNLAEFIEKLEPKRKKLKLFSK